MKLVAKDRGVSKRDVYQALLEAERRRYDRKSEKWVSGVVLVECRGAPVCVDKRKIE